MWIEHPKGFPRGEMRTCRKTHLGKTWFNPMGNLNFSRSKIEVWNHQQFNRDGESFFQLLASLDIAVVMVRVVSWHHVGHCARGGN